MLAGILTGRRGRAGAGGQAGSQEQAMDDASGYVLQPSVCSFSTPIARWLSANSPLISFSLGHAIDCGGAAELRSQRARV